MTPIRTFSAFLLVLLLSGVLGAQSSSRKASSESKVKGDEAQIRDLYDRWAKAFRARDLDAIMAVYAPGDAVIAYDIVPPLQYVGHDNYRKDYQSFLAQYSGPIEVEYRDMRVMASGDLGVIHALERMSGTLTNGQKSDIWLRATSAVRKIHGKWMIVHDHISVPTDFDTAKSALDLKP